MLKNRLESLWTTSAHDGASTPVGPTSTRNDSDFDQLMDAWYLERRNSVEFEILLEQSREAITRLLAGGLGTVSERRKARKLLMAIDRSIGHGD